MINKLTIFTIHSNKLSEKKRMEIHDAIIKILKDKNSVTGSRIMPQKYHDKFWEFYNEDIDWSKK